MSLPEINRSLIEHLQDAGLPENIFYDDVVPSSTNPLPASNHLRPLVLPSEPIDMDLDGSEQERGILQINVYTERGIGSEIPMEIAQAVKDLYFKGLDLVGVRIESVVSIGGKFADSTGAWDITPVSIPFLNFTN